MKRWLAGIVVLVLALTCVPFAVKAEEAVPTSSGAVSDFTISISDPKGDDYGPGWYKYPTNAVFKKGDFDLTGFELKSAGDNYIATFDVANLDNPWGGNGFSKQTFFLFFSTATGGSTKGVLDTNVNFADNFKWNVGLQIEGWQSMIFTASGDTITSTLASVAGITATVVTSTVGTETGTPGQVVVTIPKSAIGSLDENSKFIAWVTGQDGTGSTRLRSYGAEASEWSFGGGEATTPKVMDMIVPEGMKQEDILNYKEHTTIALPGIAIADYLPTVSKVKVLSPQDGTVTNQLTVDLKIKVLVENLTKIVIGDKTYEVKSGENDITGVALPSEGQNVISIKDANGVELAKVTLLRDTTPPDVTINTPKEGTLLNDRKVSVSLQTEPNAKVLLGLSAPDGSQADVISTSADSTGKLNIDVAFRAFTGINILKAVVTDSAGNSTTKYALFAYGMPQTLKLTIGKTDMTVNVDTVKLDAAPYIKNARTMVPVRAIAESLGAQVSYDESTKGITVTLGNHTIKLTVGSTQATVDGKAATLDAPAEIINGRTFVPVRFITEAFGCTVGWDAKTRVVTVTYP